jgi:hypothetical protein
MFGNVDTLTHARYVHMTAIVYGKTVNGVLLNMAYYRLTYAVFDVGNLRAG